MLVKGLIEEIIENFNKQQQLYVHTAAISGEQLDLLLNEQWLDKQEELNGLLIKRQNINVEIDALNSRNKSLQKQVATQLDLQEFILSHLESQIEEEQYKSLREIVSDLGDLLARINEIDEQNHSLIKKKLGPGRVNPQTNHRQAHKAYHQAVQQGKKE